MWYDFRYFCALSECSVVLCFTPFLSVTSLQLFPLHYVVQLKNNFNYKQF